jgi:WD40 repeat protein
VTSLDLGAPATAAVWIGDACLFARGDGQVVIAEADETRRVEAHNGAILSAALAPDGRALLTGGDDGRIARTEPSGASETFAACGRKWIDHVAASTASGLILAAQGKDVIVFPAQARAPAHRFTYPSSLGGLAFDAKGRRFAASHYGGATLHYALIAEDQGVALRWAGSHLSVTLVPEGDYVITAMQETGLHGWRLPDKLDLRMTGYPAKTRSFSWDRRGRWLASSGAQCAVVWPFAGKLGPQGKAPTTIGERPSLVTCVAFHPKEDLLALGYADGLARVMALNAETLTEIAEPAGAGIVALAWSADGARLAIADDAGRALLAPIG